MNELVLVCPVCRDPLSYRVPAWQCGGCGRSYPVVDGIPALVAEGAGEDVYPQEHFAAMAAMEERHFWHRGRREILLDVIAGLARPAGARACLLEIGCGNGHVLAYLRRRGIDAIGGDRFMAPLRLARQRTDAPLLQFDAFHPPFAAGFELVGLFDIIEHVEDDAGLLRAAAAVLGPGGRLVVTVPAGPELWSDYDEYGRHRRRYTSRTLTATLESAGLAAERMTYMMSALYPAMRAARLLMRGRAPRERSEQFAGVEERIIPGVNGLALAVLRLERLLLRHVDLPLGTSLLAVARKQ
jgi:SAM-dependent methyltransferase